jgi:hypothetical protein
MAYGPFDMGYVAGIEEHDEEPPFAAGTPERALYDEGRARGEAERDDSVIFDRAYEAEFGFWVRDYGSARAHAEATIAGEIAVKRARGEI